MSLLASKECETIVGWSRTNLEFVINNEDLLRKIWKLMKGKENMKLSHIRNQIRISIRKGFFIRKPNNHYAFCERPNDELYKALLGNALGTSFLN